MRNNKRIHFGTLGLKIDDKIRFIPTGKVFRVGSGNGTPGNGGTLIQNPGHGRGLYSIRLMTRLLMKADELQDDFDVYKQWEYNGKTLREIFEFKKFLYG